MGRAYNHFRGLLFVCLVWSQMACGKVQTGDCVVFREGGEGRLFKTPTYWLKGLVLAVLTERRQIRVCPQFAKPQSGYTREEWVQLAQAMPCVNREAGVHEADVSRAQIVVDSWETPWSVQHGATGLLFRGSFMNQPLAKGVVVDIDTAWLEHCEAVF